MVSSFYGKLRPSIVEIKHHTRYGPVYSPGGTSLVAT